MSQADLPIGKWQIYGNEEQGGLDISSVDSQGNFTGSAFGDKISGSFHGVSRKIHFARRFASSVDTFQVYTGHLSIGAINVDNTQYLLAGHTLTFPCDSHYSAFLQKKSAGGGTLTLNIVPNESNPAFTNAMNNSTATTAINRY